MTNDMREALEPCPFCGSLSEMVCDRSVFARQHYPEYPGQLHGFRVECAGLCHAMTCWWHTEDEAIGNWNRRAALSAPTVQGAVQEMQNSIASRDYAAGYDEGFARGTATVPEGWVLVPVEPTLAMLDSDGVDAGHKTMRKAWAAMLAAAPQPPASPRPTTEAVSAEAAPESIDDAFWAWLNTAGLTGTPSLKGAFKAGAKTFSVQKAQESPASVVKVKPLEWESASLEHWITGYQAETAFGWYRVGNSADGTFCWWFGNGFRSHPCRTLNEARAAAQADYERRILSALEPAPIQAKAPDARRPTPERIWIDRDGLWTSSESLGGKDHGDGLGVFPEYVRADLHPSDAYARGAEDMREMAELAVTRAMIALPYTSLEDVDAIGRIISALPLTEGEKR